MSKACDRLMTTMAMFLGSPTLSMVSKWDGRIIPAQAMQHQGVFAFGVSRWYSIVIPQVTLQSNMAGKSPIKKDDFPSKPSMTLPRFLGCCSKISPAPWEPPLFRLKSKASLLGLVGFTCSIGNGEPDAEIAWLKSMGFSGSGWWNQSPLKYRTNMD